jgi:hypothetical protein
MPVTAAVTVLTLVPWARQKYTEISVLIVVLPYDLMQVLFVTPVSMKMPLNLP